MTRAIFSAFAIFTFTNIASADPSQGTITNPVLSYHFGATPGTDTIDLSGNYNLGSGGPAINLPSDSVVFAFDGGHFGQFLSPNSFTCNANKTTCTYTNSTANGITSFQIKSNGTFTVAIRRIDLSLTNGTQLGMISFSVGTNTFSYRPNSVPVAKITGQTSAPVGSLLTFDATQSTDFNLNSLTYTWSIVSQPQGSSATLSSTSNPTTSMTVTTNGSYVLKVVPNDGISTGVPALFTVQVTGGTEAPPPAPGPDNGLIVLSSNLNSYLVGQAATLNLHVNVPDGNGARRYYFSATYDDVPVALTVIHVDQDYSYVTPVFTEPGTHVLKVLQFTEITDVANDLNKD